MCNYFTRFVPNLAVELAPLTSLSGGTGALTLTPNELAAFDNAKRAIADAGELAHLQEGGDLILYTDASVEGVGGYLAQRIDGIEYPIAFVSHKFSKAAARWSTIEQECYAIVFCVLKLETHLLGRRFAIETDHKNLIFMLGSAVPKIVRWRLRLSEYDFSITHIAGKDNVVADVLSRQLTSIYMIDPNASLQQLLPQLHNSIFGHVGASRTEQLLDNMRPGWTSEKGARATVRRFIKACPECQKLKGTPRVIADTDVWHHLHSREPFASVSVDVWGPFPADTFGNAYIVGVVCNFTKFAVGFPR